MTTLIWANFTFLMLLYFYAASASALRKLRGLQKKYLSSSNINWPSEGLLLHRHKPSVKSRCCPQTARVLLSFNAPFLITLWSCASGRARSWLRWFMFLHARYTSFSQGKLEVNSRSSRLHRPGWFWKIVRGRTIRCMGCHEYVEKY